MNYSGISYFLFFEFHFCGSFIDCELSAIKDYFAAIVVEHYCVFSVWRFFIHKATAVRLLSIEFGEFQMAVVLIISVDWFLHRFLVNTVGYLPQYF